MGSNATSMIERTMSQSADQNVHRNNSDPNSQIEVSPTGRNLAVAQKNLVINKETFDALKLLH